MEKERGIIFDIQRFSIHDGPGIRTLVFFKGCPLRCLWCCNPESWNPHPEIAYFKNNCIGCGKCIEVCPEKAISDSPQGKIINRAICTNCGICAETCYAEGLKLIGRYVTVTEVLEEVEKDLPFCKNSGGGITLSGGEPLLQPVFATILLKISKEHGINTAIETCGYAKWEYLEAVLKYSDLILYDIKLMDSLRHKRYTGVPNELILENVRKVSAMEIPLVIRVPVIPGYNDGEEDIKNIAKFVQKLPSVRKVNLLPYHRLGESKYGRIGREYLLKEVKPPSDRKIARLKEIVSSYEVLVS